MFREMRRAQQQLSQEECEQILQTATSGVLSLLGDDEYPYGVPVSHLYTPACLYFHGAPSGHKADAIARHGKASFCVIQQDVVVPESFSTLFRSVIVFGRIRAVADDAEKRRALLSIGARFAPGADEAARAYIEPRWNATQVYALDIEHITGKESRALMMQRGQKAK